MAGDFGSALTALDRVAELAPARAEIWFYRGRVHLDSGDPGTAAKAFSRFCELDPDHALGHAYLARALVAAGSASAAVDAFTTSLALSPQVQFFYERARLQAEQGEIGAALDGLDDARRQLGLSIQLELYAVELELSRSRPGAALRRLERIEEHARLKAHWKLMQGEILERGGRPERAALLYGAALEEIRSPVRNSRRAEFRRELEQKLEAGLVRLGKLEP